MVEAMGSPVLDVGWIHLVPNIVVKKWDIPGEIVGKIMGKHGSIHYGQLELGMGNLDYIGIGGLSDDV